MSRLAEFVDRFRDITTGVSSKIVHAANMVETVTVWPPSEYFTDAEILEASECLEALAMMEPGIGRELKLYWYRRNRILTAAEMGHEYYQYVTSRIREIANQARLETDRLIPDWEYDESMQSG